MATSFKTKPKSLDEEVEDFRKEISQEHDTMSHTTGELAGNWSNDAMFLAIRAAEKGKRTELVNHLVEIVKYQQEELLKVSAEYDKAYADAGITPLQARELEGSKIGLVQESPPHIDPLDRELPTD